MPKIEEGDGAENLVDNRKYFQKSQNALMIMIGDEDDAMILLITGNIFKNPKMM